MAERRSHIYVSKRSYVFGHGPLRDPSRNAAWMILDEYFDDLPHGAKRAFQALCNEESTEEFEIRQWAYAFIDAYELGLPLPVRRFGQTVLVDTSRFKSDEDMESMPAALYAVLEAGRNGVTSLEARRKGEVGGGISGALNKLHRAGVVVCLERKR